MKQYLYAIGAIFVVAILGFAVFGLVPADDDGAGGGGGGGGGGGDDAGSGKETCTATCTMFIKDMSNGKVYTATVSAEGTSLSEAMMLAFGGDIRATAFQSYAGNDGDAPSPTDTATLYRDRPYSIWGSVAFKVTGSDMKSIDSATIEFYGKAGAASTSSTPDHAQGTDALYCSCGSAKIIRTQNSLTSGTTYTLDSSGNKFDQVSQASGKVALSGDRVDGAVLTVYITAQGTDVSGKVITASAMASMLFKVPAYGSGALTVAITALNGLAV